MPVFGPTALKGFALRNDWRSAALFANGLAMFDLLPALRDLGTARDPLQTYLNTSGVLVALDAMRINWAITIVKTNRMPNWFPSSVPADQKKDAWRFLYAEGTSSEFLLFYHGTTLKGAQLIMNEKELAPRAVEATQLLKEGSYTDFGKGFYTHPAENKQLAIEWAKKAAADANTDEWGVVRFSISTKAYSGISGQTLLFPDKRKTRPSNSPKLDGIKNANWLEFVEHNRHIYPTPMRPDDYDYTKQYAWMRGPIWLKKDSGLSGGIHVLFDEHIHQINWGINGLMVFNTEEARKARFLIDPRNVDLFPDLAR